MTVGEYIDKQLDIIEQLSGYDRDDEMIIGIDENGEEYYAVGRSDLMN